MEAEIAKLNDLMADPELYKREPVKFQKASDMLTERQEALAAAEEEWLDLSDRT
jgi:ATP-binding cassette subfamily F protein uup